MNEDERGITPPNVTAITLEPLPGGRWGVTIEQGNGNVIKTFELTNMERMQLGPMLDFAKQQPHIGHIEFVDFSRWPSAVEDGVQDGHDRQQREDAADR